MKKKMTGKQIAAIVCLILIALSLIAVLVVALTDTKDSGLFQACILTMMFLPILCWIYIWLYGKMTQKHTIADMEKENAPSIDEANDSEN